MGNSVYNNASTGFGASTSAGAFNGLSALGKTGSKNLTFNVGGSYDILNCTGYNGDTYIKNSLPSLAVDTSGITELSWVQPQLSENGIIGYDNFAVSYNYSYSEAEEEYQPYLLFDNDSTTYGIVGFSSIYYSALPIRITRIQYSTPKTEDTVMKSITVYYSDTNNDDWVQVYKGDITNTTNPDITLSVTGYHSYYKIETSNQTTIPSIYASCTITAMYKKTNYLTTGTYHMFITDSDSLDMNAGEYSQPKMPINNLTVVGSPTINSRGDSYSFSNSNYLKIYGSSVISNPTSFEVATKVRTPLTFTSNGRILNPTNGNDSTTAPYIQVSSVGAVLVWYNGSQSQAFYACQNLASDTNYWFKWIYDGTYVYGYYSMNGDEYTLYNISTPIYSPYFNSTEFSMGNRVSDSASVCIWNGVINLSCTYIKVNNKSWLSPIITNTVWEDTSHSPMTRKRWTGTEWEDYNGSYLGSVVVADSTIGISKIVQSEYNSKAVNMANSTKPATIIEDYTNSDKSYWYNLYNDGYIVQGFRWTSTASETKVLSLLKTMNTTTYSVIATGTVHVSSKTASELTCTCTAGECSILVEGYISQ